MAAALSALPRAAAVRLARPGPAASRLLCAAAAGEASPPSPAPRRLVLYTKPGCCLCDGLKEKLHAAFLLAGTPCSLASLELQERDITTDPEWERLYQFEIPVLVMVHPDGTEAINAEFSLINKVKNLALLEMRTMYGLCNCMICLGEILYLDGKTTKNVSLGTYNGQPLL